MVPTRLFRPSRSMTRYQYMSLWPKPIVSSHGGTPCRQEQGIRQLIDGSGHVAEDEAGAEPVGGTVGQDDFPQFQAGQLQRLTPKAVQAIALVEARRKQLRSRPAHCSMKLRTRSASCQMSSYCCWVIGMTICLAPRGTCVEGVFRSRSTCRVFGRASILASPSLERSRMTKMPPAGYPAFLQYLQSGRVRQFHIQPLHKDS